MTSSRSKVSRSRLLPVLLVLAAVLSMAGVAQAGRRRVVVLELEGPKHAQLHDELVKRIKKTHTVVPIAKWNATAAELGAATRSAKDLQKVAKKLLIDAIVEGKLEQRRGALVVQLRLHQGKTGGLVGAPISNKTLGSEIGPKASALADELLEAIGNVEPNRGGPDGEDERKPAAPKVAVDGEDKLPPRKTAAKQVDDEDKLPPRKTAAKHVDDEDKLPPRKAVAKQVDDEDKLPPRKTAAKPTDDEDKLPPRKAVAKQVDDEDKLPPRKTAAKPTDDEGDEEPGERAPPDDDELAVRATPNGAELATSPGERAIDVVAGLSVTARTLSFTTRPDFLIRPAGYNGSPVGGGMVDLTLYPLALGHTRGDFSRNLGVTLMYDRVAKIETRDAMDNVLETAETRFGVGVVIRFPLGRSASAPVLGATFAYASQAFRIAEAGAVPSVQYAIYEPGVLVRLPVVSRLVIGLDAKLMLIGNTGELQDAMRYGTTSALGFEGALGLDVLLTRNLFVRAALRYETIRLAFQGDGQLAAGRDDDLTTADVKTGQDDYVGGFLTVGVAL